MGQAEEFRVTLAAEHDVVQVDTDEAATKRIDHVPFGPS